MTTTIRDWWASQPSLTRIALVVIAALGVLVRLASLAQPMRYDEAVTYLYFVGKPWSTAISAYQFPNNHLLHTVLAKLTSSVGGGAPWAIRIPAFVAGVAIIPLTYAVGYALFTPASALIGTALVAASTSLVLYSTNARGYTMVVAAYLVLLLIAARARSADVGRRTWGLFATVAAAGLATIPIMIHPLGGVVLWLCLTVAVEQPDRARRNLEAAAAAIAVAVVLATVAYAPIIHANGLAALAANKFVASSAWPQFYREILPSLWDAAASWLEPFPVVVAPLFVVAFVAGTILSPRRSHEGQSVIAAAFVWSAVVLVADHRAPFARTWIWLLPVACLLTGLGIELALKRLSGPLQPRMAVVVGVGLATCGVGWSLVSDKVGGSTDTGLFRGAESVAEALHTTLQPGDRVLVPIPSNAPLQFYMLRQGVDTAVVSTAPDMTRRSIVVLNRNYAQSIDWAIASGIIDTAHFGPLAPAVHATDADVYVAERKRSPP